MDEVRGFCMVIAVLYHTAYTMWYIYGIELGYTVIKHSNAVVPLFAWVFIIIAGISSRLSHSNLVRGFKLVLVATAITLVTFIVTPSSAIYFGIIHFFAIVFILFHFIKPLLDKIDAIAGIILCVLLFCVTYGVPYGMLGIPGFICISLPQWLYSTDFLFPIGLRSSSFFSADYFPIFPYVFLYLLGTFAGRYAAQGLFPKFLYKKRVPPLAFIGRHSLVIYVFHQPVIYAVLWLITALNK
ncbi:MAG: heparan-alpha-glucosaminide N-acetyltransferase domain-containing protein [Acutalibacteraceae bacterium]